MNYEKRGFKLKTIDQVIRSKMTEWLKSIDNESLRKLTQEHLIVTGGAITSMLLGDQPNDFDVYIDDVEVAALLAQYYIDKLTPTTNEKTSNPIIFRHTNRVEIKVKSSGIVGSDIDQDTYDYFEMYPDASNAIQQYLTTGQETKKKEYKPVAITSNAISLTDHIQIIIRFVGPASEIHKNYDFIHTTNYFTFKSGVVLNPDALPYILSKELKYVGSLYPICSMFRLKKFIKRGWTITAGEMLKIAWDISKLDLNDRLVLQDQLTGVDAAYFRELFSLLENNKDIDRTYLFELINRVFDEPEGTNLE